MTNKEIMIMKAIGEYDGAMHMLRMASERMFNSLPVNDIGETSAEDVINLNEWVARWERKISEKLAKKIAEADKM